MSRKFSKQETAYSFNDVLLEPAYSQVLPNEVDVSTQLTPSITLKIPLISAPMDTVTEEPLAISLAQEGGIGIIHKNMSIESQAEQVRAVKKFESGVVHEPVTVKPDTTLERLLAITSERKFSTVPVVSDGQLLGIITNRDVRFATDLKAAVSSLMTPKQRLITVNSRNEQKRAMELMHKHRVEKVLIVDEQFRLNGMMTVKDILKAREKPDATKDEHGQLRVGAAVGVTLDAGDRIAALVDADVDVLVIDSAHGHSKNVLERVAWIKQAYPTLQVIAGNVATSEAARALADAGADAVKVGIGPGSICTTRIVTGVGVPQITALLDVSEALKRHDVSVIADGGICFSGDICKALAAGAHAVMLGHMFAGTEEAPGEVEFYRGRAYKAYRGMGSLGAMCGEYGSKDRYFQSEKQQCKYIPEGVEGRIPYRGSLLALVYQMVGGVRAGMGYVGCETILAMHERAKLVKVTTAGMRESHVHDISITKETPNYQRDA